MKHLSSHVLSVVLFVLSLFQGCGSSETHYQLTITAGSNGTITVPTSSPIKVKPLEATTITATPNIGYGFANWTVPTGTVTFANANEASTTVAVFGGDATIQANFLPTYQLTVNAADGGTITEPASNTIAVKSGYATTITAAPTTGYIFENWTVVSAGAGVTLANANNARTTVILTEGDATIQANFKLSYGDVYVAGYVGMGYADYEKTDAAIIWKNGLATVLTDGSHYAHANSVFVSGSDVYVAGYESNGTHFVAKVWKNGMATPLTYGAYEVTVNSVFVSGSDVYVAGSEADGNDMGGWLNSVAKVWKNGVATALTDGSNQADANSVFVSGSDVYVAGWDTIVKNYETVIVATVWKNGIATALTDVTMSSGALSVFVSGDDVYVAGWNTNGTNHGTFDVATVWKNGVATPLADGLEDSTAQSVFVSGSDVYVVGSKANKMYETGVPTVWKNGTATALTDGSDYSEANSVFISGSDVYVAGRENNGTAWVATVWINGAATALTNGPLDVDAYSVYVKVP